MADSIKGAVFDVDGTLLDSMFIWDSVAADFLLAMGVAPGPELNAELNAFGGHEIPGYLRSKYGLAMTPEEIGYGMYEMLEEFYFYKAMPKSGVFAVLDALRGRGVRMCAATATDRPLIEPALRRCGLLEYFGRVFTCGEEATSKSRPDIYLRAAAFLGTEIKDTVVFEDALYAVKSAKAAGFPVIAVHDDTAADDREEIQGLCDRYFASMDEIAPLLESIFR